MPTPDGIRTILPGTFQDLQNERQQPVKKISPEMFHLLRGVAPPVASMASPSTELNVHCKLSDIATLSAEGAWTRCGSAR